MTVTIHQDFDRLQVQKEAEIRRMLIAFAKIHAVYCEQVSTWESRHGSVCIKKTNTLLECCFMERHTKSSEDVYGKAITFI